jgi:hypothetical protein
MDGDFGAALDAALTRDVAAIRDAAAAARTHIDQGVDGLAASTGTAPAEAAAPAPPRNDGSHAAVSFDEPWDAPGDEDVAFETPVDSEGIPLPEDNF